MKIPVDQKFLATTIITFVVILVFVVILEKIAGTVVATVGGGVLGGLAVKFFDKLDYAPSSHLEISNISSHIISALSGIFILYGCTIFAKIWKDLGLIIYGKEYLCNPFFIPLGIFFDFGGFIVGGWIIGHIFSNNAMRVTAVAGFFLVIALTVRSITGEYEENLKHVMNCLIRHGIIREGIMKEYWETILFGGKAGSYTGGIIRAYIAIIMARISSRRFLDKKI